MKYGRSLLSIPKLSLISYTFWFLLAPRCDLMFSNLIWFIVTARKWVRSSLGVYRLYVNAIFANTHIFFFLLYTTLHFQSQDYNRNGKIFYIRRIPRICHFLAVNCFTTCNTVSLTSISDDLKQINNLWEAFIDSKLQWYFRNGIKNLFL